MMWRKALSSRRRALSQILSLEGWTVFKRFHPKINNLLARQPPATLFVAGVRAQQSVKGAVDVTKVSAIPWLRARIETILLYRVHRGIEVLIVASSIDFLFRLHESPS
mmetsp:Transcript_11225/g.21529  ORF Transcript_11225/g.21529 Transcript_11225/m.21529 type:complete len:108 (-) Transcript_11225:589-912(-)